MNPRTLSKGKHKIFFATRPIAPPWDESSKNLVYQIAKRLDMFSIILLTYKDQLDFLNNPSVDIKKIYNRSNTRHISLGQKISFLFTFIFSNASIYHFYFTPELYSSNIFRFIKRFKRGIFLQTFATPIRNERLIPKLVIGDFVVAQSNHSVQIIKSKGIHNISRIYPAIDTDCFKPSIDTTFLRKRLNISPECKVVLYGGNYYLGCNDDLIEIIRIISKENYKIKFILACRIGCRQDLMERNRMKSILQREQIQDRVIFLEQVENMAQLIALSDIHIFPARKMYYKADLPMILLESLAMETPIIIPDIPPLNEIMKDDVGEVVPVGNLSLFVKAIQQLLKNKSLRLAKGKKGREMVIREFGLNNFILQYNTLYNKLLENNENLYLEKEGGKPNVLAG